MSTTTPESGTRPPDTGGGVLRRGVEGRMLTGVCDGLGRYAGIDPVLVRVGFAVLVLGSGIGLFLYIAAFLLMRRGDGSPGYVEQWTGRRFDSQTVLALLTGVLGFGLVMNLLSNTTGPGTIVVGTVIAIALLAAHSRGVDVFGLARSLPDRLSRRRAERGQAAVGAAGPSFEAGYGSPYPGAPGAEEAVPAHAAETLTDSPEGAPAATARPGPAPATGAPEAAGPAAAHPGEAAPPVSGPESAKPPAGRTERPPMTVPAADEAARAATAEPIDAAGTRDAGSPAGEQAAAAAADEIPADRAEEHPPGARDQTVVLPNLPHVADEHAADEGTPADTPAGAPGTTGDDGYRKLSDLAWEARSSYGSHEPFAPRGPYHSPAAYAGDDPFDPAAAGYDYGLDPALHGPDGPGAPAATTTRRRPRSFVGLVTILIAIIVGGIMAATQPFGSATSASLIGGAVLVTIGGGLLVASWFGRGVGLIAAGTIVSLALIAGTTLEGIPNRVGSYTWAPTTVAEALSERYEIGIGDGTLDLREMDVAPGSRTRLEVALGVGSLEVLVPPQARVEVHARVRAGDVTVGRVTRSGPNLNLTNALDPDTTGPAPVPVIELHVKVGVGDVEVHRD